MIHLSLRQWSGKFEGRGVVGKIRRVIAYHVARGECVLVLDDAVDGLTDEMRVELQRDWPDGKVRFSRTHPELGGPRRRAKRRGRRQF